MSTTDETDIRVRNLIDALLAELRGEPPEIQTRVLKYVVLYLQLGKADSNGRVRIG